LPVTVILWYRSKVAANRQALPMAGISYSSIVYNDDETQFLFWTNELSGQIKA
jgi:hypothetical protein